MKTMIRACALSLLVALLTGTLVSCNTMRGVGQDISATGHAIRDAFTR